MADAAFDPDAYLAQTAPATAFDPDAYLAATAGSKSPSWLDTQLPLGTSPRGLIQGGLDALPTIGMVGGGILGTPADVIAGPLGNVAGAAVGGAGGQSLKDLGEKYILGKDKTASDFMLNPLKTGATSAAAEMGGQVVGVGVKAAAATDLGKAAISKAGDVGARIGELFTGIPKDEIKTYAKNAPEINQTAKESGYDAQNMADQVRAKINDVIAAHKNDLNEQISAALEGASKDKNVDVTPVIDALQAQKARLDPSLHSEDIADIDELIKRVSGKAPLESGQAAYQANTGKIEAPLTEQKGSYLYGPTGADGRPLGGPLTPVINDAEDKVIELPAGGKSKYLTDAQGVHTITKWLQDKASSAYGSTPVGFQVGTQGANAARAAATAGREILSEAAPRVIEANAGLSRLHNIEDVMNKTMLTEGKAAGPLFAAGSGANPASAKVLKQLGNETGVDVLGEAQRLSAARTFGKPQLLPIDATGKAAGRMGAAAMAGYEMGGIPGAAYTVLGTSPAALKAAVNTGRAVVGPAGQAVAAAGTRAALQNSVSLKGEDKWANDGHELLLEHSENPTDKKLLQDNRGALLSDPKSKQLLIKASDLKPGSKAMSDVMSKIKARLPAGEE